MNQYRDDSCEDVEERGAMTDDIFFNNIRGLNRSIYFKEFLRPLKKI